MLQQTDLEYLYNARRLSMMEIARALGTTHATVLYWMKRHGIIRRSWSESAYVKQNKKGDPFAIPTPLTQRQHELLLAALFLYWGEGSKAPGTLRIANLDHRVLQLFVTFLREVCHVQEERLSVYVRLYEGFDLHAARRYWANLLGLQERQVLTYPHRDSRSHPSKQWSHDGVATLEFHNTKIKRWLDDALDAWIKKLLAGADEVRDGGATYRAAPRCWEAVSRTERGFFR